MSPKLINVWQGFLRFKHRVKHDDRARDGQASPIRSQIPDSQTGKNTISKRSDQHDSRQLATSNKPSTRPQSRPSSSASLGAGVNQGPISEENSTRLNKQLTSDLDVPSAGTGIQSVPKTTADVKTPWKDSTPAEAEDGSNPVPASLPVHHPNAASTRHRSSGKGKDSILPASMTSSILQTRAGPLRQPSQPHDIDDTKHEGTSLPSLSVFGKPTSGPLRGGSVHFLADFIADDIPGTEEQASLSRGYVNPQLESSHVDAPSPSQNPETRDKASDVEIKPDEIPNRLSRGAMDNSHPSNTHNLSTSEKQGDRASKAKGGSVDNRGKPRSMFSFRKKVKAESIAMSILEDFSLVRPRLDGMVAIIHNTYRGDNSGTGSTWSSDVENDSSGIPRIVIRCKDRDFKEKLEKEVESRRFFSRFGRIDVKFDSTVTPAWVAEPFTSHAPLKREKNPLNGTIGGIILVNGRPFALTAAHGIYYSEHLLSREPDSQDRGAKANCESGDTTEPISTDSKPTMGNREAFTRWDGYTGEVVAYRFSRTTFCSTLFARNNESLRLDNAADWALLQLDEEEIPMNTVLDGWLSSDSDHEEIPEIPPCKGDLWQMHPDATENLLWRHPQARAISTDTTLQTVLIEDILTESEFTQRLSHPDLERVPCVVVTPLSVINGFLGWGYSTFNMYETSFNVLRVDLQSQLVDGDSGSWVFVEQRVFGMIIARSGGADSPVGYLIPMEEVFRSISITLSAEVRLPTQRDYKVNLLRSRQQQRRWLGHSYTEDEHKWNSRLLELELLVAQLQAQKRERRTHGTLDVHEPNPIILPSRYPLLESDSASYPSLRRRAVFKSTISSILLLEDVFPVRPDARAKFISAIQGCRKRTHPQPRANHQSLRRGDWVVDELLLTPGGQSILIMFMFLWASFHLEGMDVHYSSIDGQDEHFRRIAKIFSGIFVAHGVPTHRIPSTDELELLVRKVIEPYRSREIPRILPSSSTVSAHRSSVSSLRQFVSSRRQSDSHKRGQVEDHKATQISELLFKLSLITRDRSEVLVCGDFLPSIPFYTKQMLGLGTEVREWHPGDTLQVAEPARRVSQDSSYIVIYRNLPVEKQLNGSELFARSEIDFKWEDK